MWSKESFYTSKISRNSLDPEMLIGGWDTLYTDENNCWKVDDSLKSFVFTLKNLQNIPARRFALKAEKKKLAIWCASE
jgi:hypothetical protein